MIFFSVNNFPPIFFSDNKSFHPEVILIIFERFLKIILIYFFFIPMVSINVFFFIFLY